jgi:hypothetical protein
MTDDPQPDPDQSGSDPSDEESTDDSRIDEFLDRIEDDQQPSDTVPPEPSDTIPSDQSDTIPPEPSDAVPSDQSDTIPPEPSDAVPSDQSDTQPTQNSTDGSQGRGRLWDSFSSDRAADGEREQLEPATEPSDSASQESPTEGAVEEWASQDPDDPEPTPSTESTADVSEFSSTTAGSTGDPEATSSSTDADETDADGTDADEDTGSSSFRTILERISHRIGSVGSGSSDSVDTDDTSTAASTDTPTPEAGPTDRTQPNSGPATGGASAGRSTAETTPSDTIDEILNNIDLFGRATSSSQVLLLSPTAHSITNDIYSRFLLPTDGAGQNILFVSATQSTSDQLAAAREIPTWREGNTAVIEVGQSTLKPGRTGRGEDVTTQLDIYKQISNLKHLAKLGINISHIVSQWNNSRRPTVVGVHTLSAIQQYVGNETMFQFLFTLKGQLNSMGVMGFYHMDPAVHTENEVSTIQSAFDLVITVSSDGSVDIL